MKEIGGYFELEKSIGKEQYDYISFNSSRNALQYIIRKRNIKKMYLPYYLCLVVGETLKNENVDIEYYHIDENFLPIIDNYDNESYIYVVNYFGLLSKDSILSFSEKHDNKVILDNTHAFFMNNIDNIDVIYNCRKYFGVPDGAYLSTNLKYEENYPLASSMQRLNHIFGRYERSASEYYKCYVEADETFDNRDIEMMSKITHNMLSNIDYEKSKKTRKENFAFLNNALKNRNKLAFDSNASCDFMYPLLIDNGQEVKKKLIENKIFVPTLWPNLDKFELNAFEQDIFKNLVLLPIDQRYDINDMKYICNILEEII